MRRIVTGHDENGKSIITLDGPPARSIGEEVGGLFELWNTDGESVTSTDNIDRADSDILLCPPKNGTKFRYFQINLPLLRQYIELEDHLKLLWIYHFHHVQ